MQLFIQIEIIQNTVYLRILILQNSKKDSSKNTNIPTKKQPYLQITNTLSVYSYFLFVNVNLNYRFEMLKFYLKNCTRIKKNKKYLKKAR